MGIKIVPTDRSDEIKSKREVSISGYADSDKLKKDYNLTLKKPGPEKSKMVYPSEEFITKDFEHGRWYNFSKAIENRIGIGREEAKRDAGFVLDIFGYEDRVIDNILDPEDRQLFYILEEEGMLTTEREETTLIDGREWRTHYWRLKKDTIMKYAREKNKNNSPKIDSPKRNKPNDPDNFDYKKFKKYWKDNGKDDGYDADFRSMTKGKTT